jgi:hypothetical protein
MRHVLPLALAFTLFAHSLTWAQAAGTAGGSIWGRVVDETGAVLPGVTVTVSSAALLGTPNTVTNEQGIYRFPSLPPGDFKLTFALSGFTTVIRDGIKLTSGFTATVDAQLRVATVEESVEVSGTSPVVDSVNTRVQTTWSKDELASIPSSRDLWSILAESPAIQMTRHDVGGSTAGTQTTYVAYGFTGQNTPVVEGIYSIEGNSATGFYYDYGSFDEVSVGAASQGAEMANPGVRSVFVSKSGGDTYHGDFYADYESHKFQTRNIDAAQIAKGVVPDTNRIDEISDLNVSAGGFIKRGRAWWFGSFRRQQLEVRLPNFPPRPFLTNVGDYTGKITYQLPKGNKLIGYVMRGMKKQPYRQLAFAVASASAIYNDANSTWNQENPGWVWKIEWNRTFGNNVFAEARAGHWGDRWNQYRHTDEPRREDLVTLVVSGGTRNWFNVQNRPQTTGAISYYKDAWAGSHTFKFGWEIQKEDVEQFWYDSFPNNVVNVLRSGAAAEVYLMLAPLASRNQLYWNGLYVTDTWTAGRLSFNLGLRFDGYRSAYPDQHREANAFAPAQEIAGNNNVATFNVLAPRLGLAWDVTGNNVNVLKVSYGRYYFNPSLQVSNAVNPNRFPQWSRYSWTDRNGDLVWQSGEEGTLLASRGAGSLAVLDSSLENAYADEGAFWFERQLGQNFGARTGIVYKRANRLFQTLNALNPFAAFNIPTTAADPGVDGIPGTADDGVLTVYNLDPSLVGRTLDTFRNAPDYVEQAWTWEVSANRRFTRHWSLASSFAVTWRDNWTAIPTNPNQLQQSDLLPVRMMKITGSYEPGWALRFSPVLRYQQGDPFARTVSVRLNYGTENVPAEETGASRRDDVVIFDLRSERKFTLKGRTGLSVFLDAFNILNSNAVTSLITSTGQSYLRPTNILAPRVFRLGAKFTF